MKILAKCLKDSYNPNTGDRLTTFEVSLPKVLLAEVNTHKKLSRNYSSSRAIPSKKFVEVDSFEPLYWGMNQAGMVAKEQELDPETKLEAQKIWDGLVLACSEGTKSLADLGLHKQWANRPCDWHYMAKGVISATNWKQSIWLRNADDSQPEIKELFKQIENHLCTTEAQVLRPGEYHLPYILNVRDENGVMRYYDLEMNALSLDDAIIISMAQCAAVSYRTESISLEKAKKIHGMLFSSDRPHMSPAEHIATPMKKYDLDVLNLVSVMCNTPGISHIRKNPMRLCSGNFEGFIQQRVVLEESI